MACTESYAGKESPLFALDPVLIPDIISISQQRVECKEWEGVEMEEPRNCIVDTRPSDLGGVDVDVDPGESVSIYSDRAGGNPTLRRPGTNHVRYVSEQK